MSEYGENTWCHNFLQSPIYNNTKLRNGSWKGAKKRIIITTRINECQAFFSKKKIVNKFDESALMNQLYVTLFYQLVDLRDLKQPKL